ncbi:hypothetical protein E8E11_004503 [Didymella keratinophila]|nr:hypothetical protein E8E11_004503 [Didymella keratinophila]
MTSLMQPFSVYDFTPPASPTKFSNTMKWFKSTPTTSPLPPSPMRSQHGSDDDSNYTPSIDCPTITQSNFCKAMRSLQKKSNTLPLQPKPSSSSLAATQLESPQREIVDWFARPSPVRAVTSAPPAAELGDNFARDLPTYKEKQDELRRRREAARRRVQSMRTCLGVKSKDEPTTAGHQRYDSGSFEHIGSSTLKDSQDGTITTLRTTESEDEKEQAPISLLHDLHFIRHALFRLSRPPLQFHCAGCKETHTTSLSDPNSPIWLLQNCRHYVHPDCFGKLLVPDTDGCFHCTHFKMRLRNLGKGEVGEKHNDLLKRTNGDRYAVKDFQL